MASPVTRLGVAPKRKIKKSEKEKKAQENKNKEGR